MLRLVARACRIGCHITLPTKYSIGIQIIVPMMYHKETNSFFSLRAMMVR